MDRPRPFLAMLICMAIFLGWTLWNASADRDAKDERREEAARVAQQAPPKPPAVQPQAEPAQPGQPVGEPQPIDAAPRPERPTHPDSKFDLHTEDLHLTFVARAGGGIEEARLPKYYAADATVGKRQKRGERQELVLLPPVLDLRRPPTLSLTIPRLGEGEDTLVDAPVALDAEAWAMDVDEATHVVTFRNSINTSGGVEGGIEVVKRIAVPEGARHVELAVTFSNRSGARRGLEYQLWGPQGLRTETVRAPGSDLQIVAASLTANGPPVAEVRSAAESASWTKRPALIGMSNNYFLAALAAVDRAGPPAELQPAATVIEARGESFPDPQSLATLLEKEYPGRKLEHLTREQRDELVDDAIKTAATSVRSIPIELEAGGSVTHHYICYLGARKDAELAEFESLNLSGVNDYGWTSWVVRLFMSILAVFHTVTQSWGASIVCLTLVVRFSLHPINKKQQMGMQRYQKKVSKIQPQINELKEKYKDDRLKMNQELQRLFKENDINPAQMMGGCLMILLQFPIWIGLIQTLSYSIDLRMAPFMGWISDLSQPDRLFTFAHSIRLLPHDLNLLPILYVILMLVQQKMQPKPTDPQALQTQRTMTIMMVAFGVIFYGFPSGLLIYFLTSTIFAIIENKLIKAKLAREEEAGPGGAGTPALAPAGPGGSGSSVPSGPLYGSSKAVSKKKKAKKQRWPGT